jgi:Flp pilus assembly protein TadG
MANGTTVTRSGRERGRERGAELIEVAITLPILLLISVGIFEFGRAFQTWEVLTNAAREGARVAVLPGAASNAAETRARAYMQAGMLTNEPSATVSVDQNVSVSIGGGQNATASRVTVNYPFSFVVLNPVARLVNPNATAGAPITITTSTTMRNESQ